VFGYASRRALLWTRSHFGNLPNWSLATQRGSESQSGKIDILIASNVGSYLPGGVIESLIAKRVLDKGGTVGVVLCDAVLPACMACTRDWIPKIEKFVDNGPDRLMCRVCKSAGQRAFSGLAIETIRLSEHLQEQDFESTATELAAKSIGEMSNFNWQGVAIGEHARAGAIRYLKADLAHADRNSEALLRRFCSAAMLTSVAYRRILDRYQPKGVLVHHGVYVPQGVVVDLLKATGTRLVTWMPSYRKNTALFAVGDTYHKVMTRSLDTPLPVLTQEQLVSIRKYLKERETGVSDWISFAPRRSKRSGIYEQLKLDSRLPIVTLYTNVSWDAQVHFEDNVFHDMFDWLRSTVRYLAQEFPTTQIVIRIHPGEVRGQLKSEQPVACELEKWTDIDFTRVHIVDAESEISSYALAEMSKFVIVYASKIGIELAARGVKVLVGGEAWVKHKGISIDPASRNEYFAALTDLMTVDSYRINSDRAERFAFQIFFKEMRDIRSLESARGYPPFRVREQALSDDDSPDEELDSVISYLLGFHDVL
jgi:hypothetical protein